jgi:hypothetical protein
MKEIYQSGLSPNHLKLSSQVASKYPARKINTWTQVDGKIFNEESRDANKKEMELNWDAKRMGKELKEVIFKKKNAKI